jgi:hypothetical protein
VQLLKQQYHTSMLGISEERKYKAGEEEFVGVIKGTDAFGRLLITKDDKDLVFQHKEVQMLF